MNNNYLTNICYKSMKNLVQPNLVEIFIKLRLSTTVRQMNQIQKETEDNRYKD